MQLITGETSFHQTHSIILRYTVRRKIAVHLDYGTHARGHNFQHLL
jgi:hypothetical protein